MKLPVKNSRMDQILDVVRRHGPLTLTEGVSRHGHFKLKMCSLERFYESLIGYGCIERDGPYYHLTPEAQAHFRTPQDKTAGPLVPPRVVNVYPRALSARYFISALGTREGSNDLRGVPSLYAPQGN